MPNMATPDAGKAAEKPARNARVHFPGGDGSSVPFDVYSSREVYDLEQERIFRGQTWSYLALEAELRNPGDFQSTFVGETPVDETGTQDGEFAAQGNR